MTARLRATPRRSDLLAAQILPTGSIAGLADRLVGQDLRLLRRDVDALLVGDTGLEPVTSSVSGKRATAAPIARGGDGI